MQNQTVALLLVWKKTPCGKSLSKIYETGGSTTDMDYATVYKDNSKPTKITCLNELIQVINKHRCFWLSSVGNTYQNKSNTVRITVLGLTQADRKWLSSLMR